MPKKNPLRYMYHKNPQCLKDLIIAVTFLQFEMWLYPTVMYPEIMANSVDPDQTTIKFHILPKTSNGKRTQTPRMHQVYHNTSRKSR